MQSLKKIISADQTRATDAYTIKNEPIASIDLMERASQCFVSEIESYLNPNQNIAVICGSGNNGGDGLAVARILMWKGFDVQPFLCRIGSQLSPDCKLNSEKIDNIEFITSNDELPKLDQFDIIIDALFGSGLTRPITGWPAEIVAAINNSEAKVYSIDIPSGMFCDDLPQVDHIVKADLVVSFQRPKLSFFFPESSDFIHEWKVTDIGLDESFIQSTTSNYFLLDECIRKKLKSRKRYSHKGTYGHALIVAGSRGKMGASVLCSRACLRSGVGLVTIHTPDCGLDILQTSNPEAMCSIDCHSYHICTVPDLKNYKSIGMGPGIGLAKETKEALEDLLRKADVPIVLDADALNILASEKRLLQLLPRDTILTPHPKEFERLAGTWDTSMERLEKQIAFSKRYDCIVVLKDAHTVITDAEGSIYINTSGNPGMATGGSGDVLTGIITGLAAQGYSPLQSALIGVYYHGNAGDKAINTKGMNALIASDLVDFLRIE